MFNLINKLRDKSESQRRSFSLAFSAIVTVFIFIVWISVKFNSFSNDVVATKNSAQENVISPITSFGKMTASALESVKESFGELKDSVDNLGNTIKTYTNEQ
ncbi:MAG: hypothetical protein U0522_02130 [Candidatus Paceibacterota bacterium]